MGGRSVMSGMNPYIAIHYLQDYVRMLEREARTNIYLSTYYLDKAKRIREFIDESAQAVEGEKVGFMLLEDRRLSE
jgi:hypothetical protein